MPATNFDIIDQLKSDWTDRYVTTTDRPELQRFSGRIGRVVTVNCAGKAIVDFADGAWYDIPARDDHLVRLPPETAVTFDAQANSAQARPERQS